MTVDTFLQDQWQKTEKTVQQTTVTTDATAGARTYTAAEILGGIILRDPAGASRSDVLPTAALLIGSMRRPRIGDTVECTIINTADAAETITIGAGAGGDFATAQTAASKVIGQNASGRLMIRVTGTATPAYVVYMAV